MFIVTVLVMILLSFDEDDAVKYSLTNPKTPLYERPISQYSIEDLLSMLFDPRDKSLIHMHQMSN